MLLVAAALASWLPARRAAARCDPVTTLRAMSVTPRVAARESESAFFALDSIAPAGPSSRARPSWPDATAPGGRRPRGPFVAACATSPAIGARTAACVARFPAFALPRRLFLCPCRSRLRRREVDTGAPGLRQADRDRLFGRRGAMFSFAHVMDLLAHEFAGLRRGRLALPLVATRALQRLLFWHRHPLHQCSMQDACLAGSDRSRTVSQFGADVDRIHRTSLPGAPSTCSGVRLLEVEHRADDRTSSIRRSTSGCATLAGPLTNSSPAE